MKKLLFILSLIIGLQFGSYAQGLKNENFSDGTATFKFHLKEAAPNPATNEVTFKYSFAPGNKTASIELFNVLGTKVKTIELNAQEETARLNVTDFNPGVYFYILTVDGVNKLSHRLVIKR